MADLKLIANNFKKEMEHGIKGEKTSLPFIKHCLAKTSLVKEGEIFQGIKIGGSILQNALIRKINNKIEIISLEEERLPVFSTGKAFLFFFKSQLRKNVRYVGLNFAYPLKPVFENNRLDGVLLSGSKEHQFTGLVGKQIGATIEGFIARKFRRQIIVAVANDTVCLALSGLVKFPALNLAGGVVGTGINFAVFLNQNELVNLESANFDKFENSPEGKVIDSRSVRPGEALYEKETSGAYLYHHYNLKRDKKYPAIVSTHELDKICRGEKQGDKKLARDLFKRAAELVGCQIAGITLFKKSSMNFVMEGSLFWQGYNFRRVVAETVARLVPKYKVNFEEIKDCGMIGAAKLVA